MSDGEVALCSLLDKFKLSSACLEIQCSDTLFLTLNTEIRRFENAAPHFGFTQPEIEELRHDFDTERQRKLEMLWNWRRKNGSDATYIAIVRIFLKMNDKQLAEVVLKHFKQEVPAGKYQKWDNMNEFEQKKVKTNLYVEHQNIRRKFSFLVDDVLKSLEERKIEVSRLKLFLATYGIPEGDSAPALLSKIESASTLADVLLIMQIHYSSWFNIQLFKDVVNRFGSNDDQRKMKEYEKDELVPYLQRSIFEIPSKSFHNVTTDLISLVLYLPDDVIPTGQHVEIIRANLSQLLGIPVGVLQFLGYDKGSTILTFAVPKALLSIAKMKNMIENYFTFNTMKNIYELKFVAHLAQLLPPELHQKNSIHPDNIVTVKCPIISSSPECADEDETQLEDDGNGCPSIESVEDTNKDNPMSLQSDIDKLLEVDLYQEQGKTRRIPEVVNELVIPTLGRSFHLGILYDYRNDCLLPNVTVWKDKKLKEVNITASEVVPRFDIITDLLPAEALGVEGSLKLSYLGGLIKENDVSGSAKYLYNYKSSKRQARVAIRYKYISHTKRVNQEVIQSDQYSTLSSEHVGTHIVTGISYGAEAIFVIDQEVADCKKYQQIYEELREKATQFCKALNKQCYVDLPQLPESTVTYFGDIPPQEKISTFQDVAKFAETLPQLSGKDSHNVIPKIAYLYPLNMLNSDTFHRDLSANTISTGLVGQIENIGQHLHDIEIRCNSLMNTDVFQYFIGIQEQLLMFSDILSKYKCNFFEQLRVLLPKIRGGQEEEQQLEKLCEKYLISQLNCEVLSSWIDGKECEVSFVAKCLEELQQVPGVIIELQLSTSVIDSMKRVIAFEFKSISGSDHNLTKMSAHLQSKAQSAEDFEEPVPTPWYKDEDIKKNVILKMKQFSSFAESNADNESVYFIVTDTSEDTTMCGKGVQLVSYIKGEPDNQDFEPPSSPYQLEHSSVQCNTCSIELTWSKPQYGSTSVQNYTVFYYSEDDTAQECKSQTTEADEAAVVITDLVPNTSYILQVQANCPTGKSEASKNIRVKATDGDSQQMENFPPRHTNQSLPVHGLQIPTLGRPFLLGMLYDYCNDCVLPDVTIWHDNALKEVNTTFSEVIPQFDIITDVLPAEALGVEGSLKLSFLGGLVKESDVSGSAKYLYNYKSSRQQARVVIRYKYISHTKTVNHEQIPNDQYCTLSKEDVGSHVVTGILYGAEAIFIIDQEVADSEKYQQISEELQEKAVQFCKALNEQCDVDLLQLPTIEKCTVTYFGDIQSQEEISTLEDVATFCKKLLGKDNPNVVPKQVCLYPLTKINSGMFPHLDLCILSTGLVSQIENIIEHLHDIEIRCNSLKKTNVYKYFIGIQEQLSKFSILVSKYKPYFVKQLAVLLPKMRGGQEKEQELEKICKVYLTSQFNCEVLSSWIDEKECEINFVAECLVKLKHVPGIKLEFPSFIDPTKTVIAFEFKAINKIDQTLVKTLHSEVQIPWHKNEAIKKNVILKMKQFSSFAKSNVGDDSITFIVTDTSEDTCGRDKGVQIVSYINGKCNDQDFEPPSSPYQLEHSSMQHDSINLTWYKPQYGSSLVESYTVFYHTEDDLAQECRSQRTKADETVMVITGLVANTSYILKVQANCTTGKSEACENITIKTRAPMSEDSEAAQLSTTTSKALPPGHPKVVSNLSITHNSIELTWKEPKPCGENIECYIVSCFRQDNDDSDGDGDDEPQCKPIETRNDENTIVIRGLVDNTNYQFSVKAQYKTGLSTNSEKSTVIKTQRLLIAPGQPKAVNKTHNSIKLTWDEPKPCRENVERYIVSCFCLDSNDDDEDEKPQCKPYQTINDEKAIVITGLVDNTHYKFNVKAQYKTGISKNSKSTVIKTHPLVLVAGPPGKPSVVNKTSNSINLKWNKPQENPDNMDGYKMLYHSKDDPPNSEWKSQQTSGVVEDITISGLVPNKLYYFKVQAMYSEIAGKTSATIETNTKCRLLSPGKPSTSHVTHNSLKLYWSEPSKLIFKSCDTIECYKVLYKPLHDSHDTWVSCIVEGTKTNTEIHGLSPATKYVFKVQAGSSDHHFGKDSKESDVIMTTHIIPGCPGKPYCTKTSDSSVQLQWTKPKELAETVQHYVVSYRKDDNVYQWKEYDRITKSEEILVTELTPCTQYYFKVQAVSENGYSDESDASDIIHTLVPIPGIPGQPELVSVTHNSVTLKWTKPTLYPQYVTKYCVYYSSQEEEWSLFYATEVEDTVKVTGLSPKTTYLFKVQAQNKSGTRGMSEVSVPICTPTPIPSPPGQPRAINISHDEITITWTTPQENAEHVQNYTIQYLPLLGTNWSTAVNTENATEKLIVSGLEPNTGYIFKVQAESVDGPSKESKTSDVIHTVVPIPSKPGQLETVSVTHNTVELKWAKPAHYAEYVINYCVSYCSEEQSKQTKISTEEEIVTIYGLSPETAYLFRVQAQSETGVSETSEVSIRTLPPKPSQPGQPQAVNISHDKITITWAKPQEYAEYICSYTINYTKNSGKHDWATLSTQIAKEVLVVDRLEINTDYIFKVQAESKNGPSKESEVSNVIKTSCPVPSQPGKPKCKEKAHDRINLVWSKPNEYYENVECYEISYSDNNARVTAGQVEEIVIDGLDPQKGYYFKVKAKSKFGESQNSLSSDHISTNPLRPVMKLIPHCKKLQDSPTVYHLSMTRVTATDVQKYAKFENGKASYQIKNKVLMIVGATGSGKSTLINGMVNYLLGVEWDDAFRLKLIHDKVESQIKSVTKLISAYTFHKQDEFPLPYSLTIIDTPGFGDTEGIARDKEITSQIKEFFNEQIDHLDGIGFVTQGGQPRLTPIQIYIFNSIFAIFGKDVKNNIFTMVTFADSAVPPVIAAIEQAGIPCTDYFQFNNSALYADKKDAGIFAKMFWDMGATSFNEFFDKFGKSKSVSLKLTREVLDQREQLETNIIGLQQLIRAGMSLIDSLKQQQQILKQNESKIKANENFEFEVEEDKITKIDLNPKEYVTNCLICNFTCHFPCYIPDDGEKYHCAAMEFPRNGNTTCTVCVGKCAWDKHVNAPFRLDSVKTLVTKCYEDIKKEYYTAVDGKTDVEIVITNMETKIQRHFQIMLQNILKVHHCIKRLHEIAFKCHPWSDVGYIDLLIESEKQDGKPGFEKRVQYYREVKKKAELMSKAEKLPQQLSPEEEREWWKEFLSLDSDELVAALPHVKF